MAKAPNDYSFERGEIEPTPGKFTAGRALKYAGVFALIVTANLIGLHTGRQQGYDEGLRIGYESGLSDIRNDANTDYLFCLPDDAAERECDPQRDRRQWVSDTYDRLIAKGPKN